MGLGRDCGQPVRSVKGQHAWDFVPGDKLGLVVRHVEGREQSTLQVRELVV